ncbi:hypothetical protein V6N12_052715 [Hibiscus sabdariffa]|uniref:Uncharacterized protein n=1 Tax=Hibiscus sabdariffa TaxID=183260 RepID=A0ABR2C2M6_9ROSI
MEFPSQSIDHLPPIDKNEEISAASRHDDAERLELLKLQAVSSYFTAACSQYSCTCRWIHRSVQQGPLPPANQRPLVGTKLRWRTLLWNLNSRNQLLQKNNDKFNRLNQAVCQRFAGNYVVTIEETRVRGNCRLAQLLTEQSIVQSEAGDIIG